MGDTANLKISVATIIQEASAKVGMEEKNVAKRSALADTLNIASGTKKKEVAEDKTVHIFMRRNK